MSILTIVIRTEILSFDPQAGMKSEQNIQVDFSRSTVRTSFVTGKTAVGPLRLNSIRDSFKVSRVVFSPSGVNFAVQGQTATGVTILPAINYEMAFELNASGQGNVSGKHDGYPAYFVRVLGRPVYSYAHKPMQLWRLAPPLDITFGPLSF